MKRVRVAVWSLAVGLWACGDSETAIDFELVQDLNLNTPEQLSTWVSRVQLVVDSPEGLYDPSEAQTGDGFRIENRDDDPSLELLVDVAISSGGSLPSVRLERGGLPVGPLDVRLEGLGDRGEVVAAGGVSSISFTADELSTVPVNFNLLSRFLPPRVLEAFPTDGELTCRAGVALLLMSKSIAPATVIGGTNLIVERLDLGVSLPVTFDVDGPIIRLAFGDVPEEPAHYRVSLGGGVLDLDGMPLDQDPRGEGEQVFATEFFVEPSPACDEYPWRWCHEAAAVLECPDFRSGRLRCEEGLCVPDVCFESSCAPGYVCESSSGTCLVDCRTYGDFGGCSDDLVCDGETGQCR